MTYLTCVFVYINLKVMSSLFQFSVKFQHMSTFMSIQFIDLLLPMYKYDVMPMYKYDVMISFNLTNIDWR